MTTPLEGVVRVVEPAGFTKVSALGVEEQRVLVISEITSPPMQWEELGDGYRVEALFVLWEGDNVLQVPASALFRYGDGWAVFTVEGKRARRKIVTLGHRSGLTAEIVSGLTEGESIVITHPDEAIEDGSRVRFEAISLRDEDAPPSHAPFHFKGHSILSKIMDIIT